MARRLPSPVALRAFEVAARHLSFTAAAAEMNVTQGAISRHVKFLEGYLGLQLFRRLPRALELTPEGQSYYTAMHEAFDIMERATRRLIHSREDRILTLSVLPTLAMNWIIPELPSFNARYPSIDVRLQTSILPADFQSEIDIAIRVGRHSDRLMKPNKARIDLTMVQDWNGLDAEFLMPDFIVAVCSPSLLEGEAPLQEPGDIKRFPLLQTTNRIHAWADWGRALDVPDLDVTSGTGFAHFFMTLEAARAGLGVACVPTVLVRDDLDAGRLVAPFPQNVESEGSYYLIYRKHEANLDKVRFAREWLKEAAIRLNGQ
ncbi:MAG TPA: transcriptional regulator GcvA [Pseudolabrys sp.]|nr:transcriptional regulator GcvA [Pseudolabrys sp.]